MRAERFGRLWRRKYAGVGALLGLLTVMGLMGWPVGIYVDEGTFLTVAQEIWRGAAPYRDIIDNKFPLLYLILLPVVGFFPPEIAVVRLFAWAAFAGATVLFYLLLRGVWSPGRALAGALLWAAVAYGLDLVGVTLVAETLVLPALFGFYAVFFRPQRTPWANFALGLCFATAAGLNQHAFFLGVPLLYALVTQPGRRFVLAGMAAVLLPLAAYLTAAGLWGDMIFWALLEPVAVVSAMPAWERAIYLTATVFPLALVRLRLRDFDWAIFWLLPGLAFGLIDQFLTLDDRKILYFLPPILYYALGGAGGWSRLPPRMTRRLATALLLCALTVKFVHVQQLGRSGYPTIRPLSVTAGHSDLAWMSRYAQQVAVQDYLRAVSADSLFVWGRNVEFYYLADLPPPVRLVHLWAHYMRRFEREPAFFRAEILDPLTAAPPAYILVNRHDTSVRFFDGLDPFLAAGYRQAADFDGVVLYARRVPVDAPDGTDIQ